MKKNGRIIGDVIPMITMAILFIVILMLVVFSAISYQKAVEVQDGNNNARAILSYMITAVKANAADPVGTEERDGMPAMVIQETATGYEQMIFEADGKVYEAYGETGLHPDPEDALLIGETGQFTMNWVEEDLLEIHTDAGNSYIHVQNRRSDTQADNAEADSAQTNSAQGDSAQSNSAEGDSAQTGNDPEGSGLPADIGTEEQNG